jgi:putative addiction module component (TIGR02574 family)
MQTLAENLMSANSSNPTTADIIASVLQLPLAARVEIVNALEQSLSDDSIEHGPEDPPDEVEAAWSDEIARRIADIDSGRVKTIPAEEAERMIRGDARPRI